MLIIVDPISRGSRLYYARAFAKAASTLGISFLLIIRDKKYWEKCDILNNASAIIQLKSLNNWSKWYGRIGFFAVLEIANVLKDINRSGTRVVFVGINEIFPYAKILSILFGKFLTDIPWAIIDYSPSGWLENSGSKIRKIFRKHLCCTENLPIVCHLDENFPCKFENFSKVQFYYLREFSQFELHENIAKKRDAKILPDKKGSNFTFLMVGNLTERKGVRFLLNVLDQNRDLFLRSKYKFLIRGRLSSDTLDLQQILYELSLIGLVHFDETYLAVDDMQRLFLEADAVLLPYNTSFTGSSGVLADAIYVKRPVVASSHGIVGRRVTAYNLGEVFKYGDNDSFIISLRKVEMQSSIYSTVKARAHFSMSSISKFLIEFFR